MENIKTVSDPFFTHNHPFAKQCCMTIFMHDLAFPKEPKGLWPINWNPPAQPIQIFTNTSIDILKHLTNEQIGRIVRQTLNQLDEFKKAIEQK